MVALEYILVGALVGAGVGTGAAVISASYEGGFRDLAGAVPRARAPATKAVVAPARPGPVPVDPNDWPTP